MNESWLYILAITFLGAALSFMAVISYTLLIREREKSKRDNIMLDLFREGMERQVYNLNSKILEEANRFKDVNHLILEASESREDDFYKKLGIEKNIVKPEKDLVFVLTPFHPDFEQRYKAISDACLDLRLKCERGDEVQTRGSILRYIVNRLISARVVVAVLDGRSPNVYYELGLAHMMNKKVLLIAKSPKGVPVDLRGEQIIMFDDMESLRSAVAENLKSALISN
ncbi:hypothetical protein [Oceanicaulis alexandrii]|uniref:hypothetical protein n=1 Tax=Oceanicaulis alexandrii TaxID=153233 RepID=UPI0023520A5A|nr:hypothetical protein [Oceanicaulis alexandrii]